jgi:hypothetical protein
MVRYMTPQQTQQYRISHSENIRPKTPAMQLWAA